jgi:hypothetical protein
MRALLALVILICGSNIVVAQDVSERFVGSWSLVSDEFHRLNGDVVPVENPLTHGLLIYTAAGHMSVQMVRGEREQFAAFNPTVDEAFPAFMTYISYYGTFTVNEADETVTHHREGNLRPLSPDVIDATRSYRLSGTRLALSRPPIMIDDEEVIPVLTFERVE